MWRRTTIETWAPTNSFDKHNISSPVPSENPRIGQDDAAKDAIRKCPLVERAWTLQERHLSTRVIHFTKTHVMWECRMRCYYYQVIDNPSPYVWDTFGDRQVTHGKFLRCFDKAAGRINISPRDSPITQWFYLLENFTMRYFTDPYDKLNAIASLAEAMQPLIKSRYVAGIWIDLLPSELLWKRRPPQPDPRFKTGTHSPYTEYYAPSWSWASAHFPIYPTNRNNTHQKLPTGSVIEVDVQSKDGHPMPGSCLRLRTLVQSLRTAGSGAMQLIFDDNGDWIQKNKLDTIHRKVLSSERQRVQERRRYIISRLISEFRWNPNDHGPTLWSGLILRETGIDRNGIQEFQRVGVALSIEEQWIEQGAMVELLLV